jgi:hypothetical protein
MRYYTFHEGNNPEITDYPGLGGGSGGTAVFPAAKKGMHCLQVYAKHFTALGELVANDEYGLYIFEADAIIDLPFSMNLNYTDAKNAKKLDQNNFNKAVQILSRYAASDIINSGEYIDLNNGDNHGKSIVSDMAFEMNHSRGHLIHLLSSIAKTIGQVVANPDRHVGEAVMEHQVLVTTPVRMTRIPRGKAVEILDTDVPNPLLDVDVDDEGEYGMGGDWWKNQQEAIIKIAKLIDEDLI